VRGWVKHTQGKAHLWAPYAEGTRITLCGSTVAMEEVILSTPSPKGACGMCFVLAPSSPPVAL